MNCQVEFFILKPGGARVVPSGGRQRHPEDLRAEGSGRQVHARAVLHVLAALHRPRAASQGADTHETSQGERHFMHKIEMQAFTLPSFGKHD